MQLLEEPAENKQYDHITYEIPRSLLGRAHKKVDCYFLISNHTHRHERRKNIPFVGTSRVAFFEGFADFLLHLAAFRWVLDGFTGNSLLKSNIERVSIVWWANGKPHPTTKQRQTQVRKFIKYLQKHENLVHSCAFTIHLHTSSLTTTLRKESRARISFKL